MVTTTTAYLIELFENKGFAITNMNHGRYSCRKYGYKPVVFYEDPTGENSHVFLINGYIVYTFDQALCSAYGRY